MNSFRSFFFFLVVLVRGAVGVGEHYCYHYTDANSASLSFSVLSSVWCTGFRYKIVVPIVKVGASALHSYLNYHKPNESMRPHKKTKKIFFVC